MDEINGLIINKILEWRNTGTKWVTARNLRKALNIDSYDRKKIRKISKTLLFLEHIGALKGDRETTLIRYEILDDFEKDTKYILPLCRKERSKEDIFRVGNT